jgi:autotransporter-associated beta strand protein
MPLVLPLATGGAGFGVYYLASAGVINSGTGTIYIEGYSQTTNTSTYGAGLLFALNASFTTTITSANTTADAIKLLGIATGTGGDTYGMEIETSSPVNIYATGAGGGITLSTSQRVANHDIVIRSELQILAASGDIKLLGSQNLSGSQGSTTASLWINAEVYIGSKSGTTVTSSSSDVYMTYQDYSFNSYRPYITTSGKFDWKSPSDSFTGAVNTGWWRLSGISGLYIGKLTNAFNITLGDVALSVAGPIEILAMGGTTADITFTTAVTNSANNSSIILKASRDVVLDGAVSFTGTGSNSFTSMSGRDHYSNAAVSGTTGNPLTVNVYTDVDNTGGGAIILNTSSRILSYGGNITLRGGTGDTTAGCGAAKTCIAGYASNSGGDWITGDQANGWIDHVNAITIVSSGSIDAGSGTIDIFGNTTSTSTHARGIIIYPSVTTLKAGGNITLNGISSGQEGVYFSGTAWSTGGNISITGRGVNGIFISGTVVAGDSLATPSALSTGTVTLNGTAQGNGDYRGIYLYVNTNILAGGAVSMNGNAAPNGVNSTTGGYYGILLWTTGITIRSFNAGVDLFGSSAQLDGIYIYDGSSKIWGKTNVNLTGIGLARSGIFTAANGTGGGIKSFDGDVFIKGISNTTDRPGVYIEVPIEATVGSVTVSGAGKFNGIKFDTGYSGSIVAGAAVNLIGYSIDGDAIYMNKTGSPIISSGTGDITFSGYVESGASNMYGVYAATGVNISSTSGDVIFQSAKIDGVTGTGRTRLVNAATAATPVYATADSANIAFGSSSGLSFAGNISVNTTDGYIKLGAKNPTITGVMSGFGLLLTGTGQTYSLSGNNTLSTIAADIGSGSLTYTTTSTMTVGTVGTTTGISAGSIALTAGGSGVVNTGGITINITSSANTITGGLSGAGDFSTATGNTLTLSNTSGTPDYTGIISGPVVITKSGAGTQKFSGASTYTGGTSVTNGTLQSGANTTAGPPPTSGPFGTGTITVNGGVLDLNGKNVGNALSITGTGLSTNGVIINSNATAGEVSGTVTMTAASSIGGTNPYTISGVISGGFALTKLGTNVVTLSGNNTYTGATSITAGTLVAANSGAVGTSAGGISITSGATLALQGGITIADAINTASGAGVGSLGAILNNSGSNTITGLVTLGAATTIGSTAGTLTFDVTSSNALIGTHNLTFTGAGDITVADPIATSTGTLTKSGNGTLTLSANNTYTGATSITAGTLVAANSGAVGTSAGGISITSGATLALQGGITIADAINTASGAGVGSLGAILNNSGSNTITGLVTLGAATTIGSTAGTLTFDVTSSNALIGTHNLTFTGAGDITVADPIATSTGTLTKSGNGTLTLSANNTYTGATTISNGVVRASNNTALGTVAGGVTVSSGAALELIGGITIGDEALTLNNTGISSGGALRNISGNNTYGGLITLSTNAARINSDSGTLTLNKSTTAITASNINLTIGGSGDTTISTAITTGSGTLTKDGSGTLILSGNNSYTGLTTVSAGTLKLGGAGSGSNSPLGTIGSGTVVESGAALDLAGFNLVTAEALTISGTGVSTSGALFNSSATASTYLGAITLAADTTIKTTGDLTLSSTVDGAFALTVTNTGILSFGSTVGTSVNRLSSLSVSGSVYLYNNVWTSGTQSYSGDVVLAGSDISLNTTNSAVSVSGNISVLTGIIKFLGGGNYSYSSDSGVSYQAYTAGSGAQPFGVTITYSSNTYTWSTPSGITSTAVLVVAGGGSGGSGTNSGAGGGGGAGGLIADSAFAVSGNYSIVVGAGGTAATLSRGNNGGNSNFGTLVATGGGGGGYWNVSVNVSGSVGGSGGGSGAGVGNATGGAGTADQGFAGGGATGGSPFNGAGGGGAGGIGGSISSQSGTSSSGANGGLGLSSSITGSSLFYAGGGGGSGGQYTTNTGGSGGSGIGGTGSNGGNSATTATAGATNTGSGGGGANIRASGAGGSGIVVVNYGRPSSLTINAGTGRINLAGNATSLSSLTLNSTHTNNVVAGVISGATTVIINGGATVFNGANSYTGTTTVSAGTLKLGHVTALGTVAAGTTVASGAVLDLNGKNIANAEALTISGTGISSGGALINSSATGATYAGLVTLGANSSIVGETGTIALSNAGTITGTYDLTLGGAQGGSITSIVGISTGSLTKVGAGTWTMSGLNTYSGGTSINAGILKAGSAKPFGAASGAVTLTAGAVLDLNGQTLTNTNALTLNGMGISTSGALTNSSATTGVYAGSITLGSISAIGGTGGTVSVTGAVSDSVNNYGLIFIGNKAISLSSTSNALRTIASDAGIGALTIVNTGELTIGSISTYNGIDAVGAINIRTTGDLIISKNVVTTNASTTASAPAILLASGSGDAAGTTTNNILLRNSSTITAGTGGIIDLYTGGLTESATLKTYVEAQTTNSAAYNSTLTTQPTTAGYNIIYRGFPPYIYVTIVDSQTGTYGTASGLSYWYSTSASSYGSSYIPALLSSFTTAQTFTAGQSSITINTGGITGTIGISTTLSSTLNANTYSLTLNPTLALSGAPGVSFLAGDAKSFVVNRKTVELSATKTYDSNTSLTNYVTVTTGVGTQTLTYTGATANDANVATANKFINAITLADGTNGGLASNYQLPTLNRANAPVTINAKTVTLSAEKTYDSNTSLTNYVTMATGVGTQTLTYTGAAANDANVATADKYISAITLANGTNGGVATNYQLPTLDRANAPVTINAKTVTLSAEKTYDGSTSLTNYVTVATGIGSQTLTYTGAAANDANVATADKYINAITLANGSNGGVATNYQLPILNRANAPVTINAKTVTLSAEKTYDGGTSLTGKVTITTGVGSETLTYTGATVNNANVATANKFINAITLANGSNGGLAANYQLPGLTAAAAGINTVSINKATLTVTADDKSRVYGDSNPSLTYTIAGYVNSENATSASITGAPTISTTATAASNVNAYTITSVANNLAASNYQFSYVDGTLTINRRPVTVTADNKTREYGESNPALTFAVAADGTGTSRGMYNSQTLTGSVVTTAVATTNVGNVSITQGTVTNANNANYDITYNNGTLSITTAELTYNATAAISIYGSTPSVNAGTVTGWKNSETASTATTGTLLFSTTADGTSNIGSYAINGSGLTANHGNYTFAQAAGNSTALTINQKSLTITSDARSTTYGTALVLGTSGFTSSGLVNTDSISGVTLKQGTRTTVPATQAAGTYSGATDGILASAAQGTGLSNYSITYTAGTLTIDRKALTVTGNNDSKTYGDVKTYGSGSTAFTSSGLVNSETIGSVTITDTNSGGVNTAAAGGTYALTPSSATGGTFSTANYNITYTAGALTVNKASLTVTADNKTRVYGDSNPALSYTITGYVNSQDATSASITGAPTISTTATAASNVNTYTITSVANNLAAANYEFTYTNGTLTVNRRPVTVTADDKTRVYGDANPALTFAVAADGTGTSRGMYNSQTLTGAVTTAATQASNVGTAAITQNTVTNANNSNYDITFVDGTLTINRRPVTVTADNKTRVYGDANPALTFAVAADGTGTSRGMYNSQTLSWCRHNNGWIIYECG